MLSRQQLSDACSRAGLQPIEADKQIPCDTCGQYFSAKWSAEQMLKTRLMVCRFALTVVRFSLGWRRSKSISAEPALLDGKQTSATGSQVNPTSSGNPPTAQPDSSGASVSSRAAVEVAAGSVELLGSTDRTPKLDVQQWEP